MKMRLLTGLIAAVCFSQAASAAQLSGGTISNLTTATADVEFSQPITLQNTLTPISGLKAGQQVTTANPIAIANGSLAIKDSGVTALLALKFGDPSSGSISYAAGHEGEDDYSLHYIPLPKDAELTNLGNYDLSQSNSDLYIVTRTASSKLDYRVLAFTDGTSAIKPGIYSISVTGAIYNP